MNTKMISKESSMLAVKFL